MPKRSTTIFSSEDAEPVGGGQAALNVYHCAFSGEHVLTTDAVLASLPRRRTDGAAVLDTARFVLRLMGKEEGVKYLRRGDGQLERQLRHATAAGLVYGYRTEPDGRYVYLLPDALTCFSALTAAKPSSHPPPPPHSPLGVPLCVRALPGAAGVQLAVLLRERSRAASVLEVGSEEVTVAVTGGAAGCASELQAVLARALGVRAQQLTVLKGWSEGSRLITVAGGVTPAEAHAALLEAAAVGKARGVRAPTPPPEGLQPRPTAE